MTVMTVLQIEEIFMVFAWHLRRQVCQLHCFHSRPYGPEHGPNLFLFSFACL